MLKRNKRLLFKENCRKRNLIGGKSTTYIISQIISLLKGNMEGFIQKSPKKIQNMLEFQNICFKMEYRNLIYFPT